MLKQIIKIVVGIGLLSAITSVMAMIPMSDKDYSSAIYAGVEGGYIYTIDKIKTTQLPVINQKNHRSSYTIGGYVGYGHVFDHGNLPYLGLEFGYNNRAAYSKGTLPKTGNLYGFTINAKQDISLDLLPGVLFDDNTGLVYGRLGIEGDQFCLKGNNIHQHKNELLFRIGIGIEHQVINNFYLRADYVLSYSPSYVTFKPYAANQALQYSDKPWFNAGTIGLSYRFPV